MNKHENSNQKQDSKFYRFQVFQGELDDKGRVQKTKNVGMAYLKDGHQTITLRLWTFVSERFYLILNQNDASKYLVMTRELNKSQKNRNKYFWNIVGNGSIDTVQGIVRIELDLFDKPIYMNVHPEKSAFSVHLPEPDFAEQAA